jgi:RNA polymerase sigma-70 factor (family 1)
MSYKLLGDNLLVNMLKDDDELAFKEIYVRYWKELYRVAYTKTHLKEVSEELTQNLFVDLWRRRQIVVVNSLSCYLFGSLKFSIINHYKSQLIKDQYQVKHQQKKEPATSPADELTLLNDLSTALNHSIALLPKKTGEVFRLSRIDNCSTKEISQQLNISEKAVEYHITQSLKSMRYYLKEYLFTSSLLITLLYNFFK